MSLSPIDKDISEYPIEKKLKNLLELVFFIRNFFIIFLR